MSLSVAHQALPLSRRSERYSGAWSPNTLRGLLLVGCLASVAAAAWTGEPSAYVRRATRSWPTQARFRPKDSQKSHRVAMDK